MEKGYKNTKDHLMIAENNNSFILHIAATWAFEVQA